MIAFLFWGGFALSCISVFLLKRKIEFVKCAVLGMTYYFMLYVVVSGLLFMCGQFSLKRVTFFSFALWGGAFVVVAIYNRKKGALLLNPLEKQSWLSYLIIVILLIAFSGSFGYFGMGQDQGVYQVEAINIANGRNEWLTSFLEYDQITDEEYKNFYREAVDEIPGVELVDVEYSFRDTFHIPKIGDLDVIYHAIPTYPAILGLAVKLFGMDHMMVFQVVFYVLMLLLIEFLLREHQVHWLIRAVLITVLGVSPEILWIRKSTLTEMFLAVLLTYYLYKILDEDDKQKSISVLPIIVFSFFHASAFSIFPVFVVNYWLLYLVKKDMRFLRNAAESIAGLCIGFIMMFRVEPVYMAKNFMRLMEQNGLNMPYSQVFFVVIIVSIIAGAAGFCFLMIRKDVKEIVMSVTNILISAISFIALLDFLSGRAWWGGFFNPALWIPDLPLIGTATFMGYLELTGFFLLPIIILRTIGFVKKRGGIEEILVGMVFVWTVLIYSMLFRLNVMSYYYNARYLVPFFPVIIVMYGLLFGKSKTTEGVAGKVYRRIFIVLPVLGIVFMLPFSNVIRLNQDDTNLQWSTLSDLMNHVQTGDTVLLDQNEMWYFFYPLRSKGVLVYPVMDSFETTIEKARLNPDNQNIYYITENRAYEDDWKYEVSYESLSKYQLDDQTHYVKYLMLPTEFAQKGERNHILYHWVIPETQINARDDNFSEGWSVTNAAGFRWMNNQEADVGVYLEQADCKMRIQQGDSIPFGAIAASQIKVDVFINGHELESLVFTGDTNGKEFIVDIPKEYIIEGRNKISFETDNMWSPKEYGQEDPSQYAFSVATILFDVD